jgi:hypothetical protein
LFVPSFFTARIVLFAMGYTVRKEARMVGRDQQGVMVASMSQHEIPNPNEKVVGRPRETYVAFIIPSGRDGCWLLEFRVEFSLLRLF